MAVMIPSIDPLSIENSGERAFYQAASRLPQGYTVLYSYKYKDEQGEQDLPVIREADFVIVHPSLGYLVVKVKQGDIAYYNGEWHEYKGNRYQPMHKNPVDQARNAAFAILSAYREKINPIFPLKFRYAVAFPECTRLQG